MTITEMTIGDKKFLHLYNQEGRMIAGATQQNKTPWDPFEWVLVTTGVGIRPARVADEKSARGWLELIGSVE